MTVTNQLFEILKKQNEIEARCEMLREGDISNSAFLRELYDRTVRVIEMSDSEGWKKLGGRVLASTVELSGRIVPICVDLPEDINRSTGIQPYVRAEKPTGLRWRNKVKPGRVGVRIFDLTNNPPTRISDDSTSLFGAFGGTSMFPHAGYSMQRRREKYGGYATMSEKVISDCLGILEIELGVVN